MAYTLAVRERRAWRRWLDSARLRRRAALLAFLIGLPTVGFGLQADDHLLHANVRGGDAWRPIRTARWDLFNFYGDATAAEVIDRGLAPWWANPKAHSRLFRPLSSLIHSVELSAWSERPALMHVHSLIWYALLCALAALLYRRFIAGWAAGLAALWFVVDYTHGPPMAWIANRNALIAGAFSMAAIALHDHRHRTTRGRGHLIRAAAAVCLGLAFAAGEVALAGCAYLFAYALCIERGPLARRLVTLWPYAGVGAAWVALYVAGEFGVRGSGAYFDPLSQPAAYLRALLMHAPLQLSGELGGPMPDFWMVLPPAARAAQLVIAVGVCTFAAVALWPLLCADRVARFFGLGAALALLPVCAAFPSSRLMLIPGFGLLGLLATLVQGWRDGAAWMPASRRHRRVVIGFAVLAGVSHTILAPPLLFVSQRQIDIVDRQTQRLNAGLPNELSGRHLIIANPPDFLIQLYSLPARTSAGKSLPDSVLFFGEGTHAMSITRVDDSTLIVGDDSGFFGDGFASVSRPPGLAMPVGTKVELGAAVVRVRKAKEGVPTEASFTLRWPARSGTLVWRQWNGHTLVPFTPPSIGQTVVVAALPNPLMDPAQFP